MYPIMVDLTKRNVLIVGGGTIATRKAKGIISAGGMPVIIAPEISDELQKIVNQYDLQYEKRSFQLGDTTGYDLIFICTNQPKVNQKILAEVKSNQWVNDTTKHENSDFYNMSTIREDRYLVATSTYGKNPSLSKRLRRFIKKNLINFD